MRTPVIIRTETDLRRLVPLDLAAVDCIEDAFRALARIGYDGPVSVEWEDAGMDRLRGAPEALEFLRRFDFDPEAVVRLCWRGVRPVNLDAPVRYFRADEGGVSHFRYLRDNLLLTGMHARLFLGFTLRLPLLLLRRLRG